MHPHTISGAQVPGRYSSTVEADCLRFGVLFAFGMLSQLVTAFENTKGVKAIQLSAEPIFVDLWSFIREPPVVLLADDLAKWDPTRYA
jgi:hypothetical protein